MLQATPLNTISDLRIEGRGLLANLRDKDNLSTADKTPAPNVSVVWRFHCNHNNIILLLVCHCLETEGFKANSQVQNRYVG